MGSCTVRPQGSGMSKVRGMGQCTCSRSRAVRQGVISLAGWDRSGGCRCMLRTRCGHKHRYKQVRQTTRHVYGR
jgi:hypothetical protein